MYQAQIRLLLTNKTFIKVLSKYFNYIDIFLFNFAIELSKNTCINEYIIKQVESKQLFYKPIYSLRLVKLKILKIYMETYQKTWFIWLSNSLTDTFIFFHQKLDKNLRLYIDD